MENSISDLLKISLTNLENLIDVNVIVGDMVTLGSAVVIPISKVKCGFITGGVDQKKNKNGLENNPFGGGTGGNITITPMAFLVYDHNEVSLLHLDEQSHILEKLIDLVPAAFNKITNIINDKKNNN